MARVSAHKRAHLVMWGALTLALISCTGLIDAPAPAITNPEEELTPKGPSVGEAPLKRLTKVQLDNALQDLLGTTSALTRTLPPDERAGGFSANALAPVTEAHVETYQALAEALALEAVTPARLSTTAPCAQGTARETCTATFVSRFGRLTYRRPLTDVETTRYAALAAAQPDYTAGVRLVVQAMLQSPSFWYRVETPPVSETLAPVFGYVLASRLSFFLWNSGPDDALLDAAGAGELDDPTKLTAQIERMLADARFSRTLHSFHEQWLNLETLTGVEKDATLFPAFNPGLRASMEEQTDRFVSAVMRDGDATLTSLLTTRRAPVNAELFDLYGLTGTKPAAGEWVTVELDPAKRSGILTLPSVMTTHAHADQTSLVRRGKMLRERLLCGVITPPPGTVNNVLPPPDPNVSARQRFELHRSEPSCKGCHALIDPLGSPFEEYDAIGRFRTQDGLVAVDSTGELVGTRGSNAKVKDAVELADKLVAADDVQGCVARQWLRYAIGRADTEADRGSLLAVQKAFKDSQLRIPALVQAIVKSDALRYQVGEP